MCVDCEKSTCNECIKKINSCPNCKLEPIETRNFIRFEKKIFNSIKINCPNGCEEISSYETFQPHLKICKNNIKTFKCKNCEKIIETQAFNEDIINEHLRICEKLCKFCGKKCNLLNVYLHESKCLERISNIFSKFLEWISINKDMEEFMMIVRFFRKFLAD